jgi:hypothetical protein
MDEEPNQITSTEVQNAEKPHQHFSTIEHVQDINAHLTEVDTYEDDVHVPLGWRSWLVVLVTLYG